MGGIAAGTGLVAVGAGVVAFTCYDRVTVTVTDRLTGTKLCDARVTFKKGSSETVATSCGQAALSAGKYRMRVERVGLVPFEQAVDVVKSEDCGSTTQTMFVALERPNHQQAPQQVAPPRPAPAVAPAAPVASPVEAAPPPPVAPASSSPPTEPAPASPPAPPAPGAPSASPAPPAGAPPAAVPSAPPSTGAF
ncbi:MAG: hypothetical protein K0R38_4242 [Polyangiaceae bacterium]|nr:hypothetical protein [Polyangiaceae bacterium]